MPAKNNLVLTRKRETRETKPTRTPEDFVEGVEPFMLKSFRIPVRLAHKLRMYSAKTRQTDTKIIVTLLENLLQNEKDT